MRNHIHLAHLSAIFMVSLALGCSPDESASNVSHDHGEPTRSNNDLFWFGTDQMDFTKHKNNLKNSGLDVMYPGEAPLTYGWTKFWVDTIDAELRSRYPDKLLATPKPEVALIRTKSPNAFISSSAYCFKADVAFEGRELGEKDSSNRENEGTLFLSAEGVEIYSTKELNEENIECVSGDSEKIEQYFDYFSDNTTSKCKITSENSQYKLSGCKPTMVGLNTKISSVTSVVMLRVAPYVNLNLGMIDIIEDESSLVSIIAHELGHYYRSHSNKVSGEYNYFYKVEGKSRAAQKPIETADKNLIALGKNLQLTANANTGTSGLAPVKPTAGLDPVNFVASGNLIKLSCQEGADSPEQACPKSCTKVLAFENPVVAKYNSSSLAFYPYESQYSEDLVQSINEKMLECLTFLDQAERINPKLFPLIYSDIFWNPHVSSKASVFAKLSGLSSLYSIAAREFDLSGNIFDVFDKISQSVPKIAKLSKEHYRSAFESKLGWYTAEQEADDIATEYLHYLGLNPIAGADAFLTIQQKLIKQLDDDTTNLSFGFNKCKQLYELDFSANGSDADVPVGDFIDDHHSICYRAFNIVSESAAHVYKSGKSSVKNSFATYQQVRDEVASFFKTEGNNFNGATMLFDDETPLNRSVYAVSGVKKLAGPQNTECRYKPAVY